MFRLFFVMNFFAISLFLKIAIERLLKYSFSVFNVLKNLTSFFIAFSFSVSLLRILFFFDKCLFLLLLFLLLLRYLYLNSRFLRNEVVIRWHFVDLFHWCFRVFDDCEIEHWAHVICSSDSFHFFMFYRAHSCSGLMLCLLEIDASMCDFYFVFTASIRLVIFCTMIAFHEILAHFFDVIIFVTVKALRYSTFFWEYHCILSTFFFQKFIDDYSIDFFWKFCFYY